ncbi:toll/interleukin-1 receptor domain-containing protein [Pseudomonas sp. 10S4]|uniref:toll/interleukin-1 receptor domain-containing protein n=1 Tax=Pseudomonas sp. 10S4 TaxID=3048583 RepID=UPI002AC8DDB7|nr:MULTISPECIES: toll/interleukin-1 receptor domain-containing protein [unclassified Pseudomonas]MEB0222891.1 toll/interleukin-1 receptor domain-containing protein [Pseudomonas sp. 5S1]MEB0293064.1 toll/interleukin-1 receptor domain-containing protein [Pseudomonas sp. 10S4]WPX17194.1 toll/interleukin-1 receptor domain-containing protein [Pseudomonas sp. 10S4]
MAFFTKAEVRKAAQQAIGANRSARDVLSDARKTYKEKDRFDIFLSHSFADAELVLGVKVLLEAQGLRVYVDWVDDKALERDQVTEKTADVLRKRMRQSESLLYLASDNASKSKWMPWELGYFDGFKNGGVSILPVLEKSDSPFEGQEYLGLYPIITKEKLTQSNVKQTSTRVIRPRSGTPFDPGFPTFPLGGPRIYL